MERMTNDTPYWKERLSAHDTISRQAAIDAFLELDIELRPSAIDAITGMLKELPSAQPEQRWIPCNWRTKEENLPQECKSVLICMKDGCGYRIGVSYRTDYNRWEGYGRVNVIAWMPLPEPYRKDGEADGDG